MENFKLMLNFMKLTPVLVKKKKQNILEVKGCSLTTSPSSPITTTYIEKATVCVQINHHKKHILMLS